MREGPPASVLLALDSTDSRAGGCTTHVAWAIAARLSDFSLRGPARLVRLNPNVPYKTRGNGALALDIVHGSGRRVLAGQHPRRDIWAYEDGEEPSRSEVAAIMEIASAAIDELRADDSAASSGLVAFAAPPSSDWYMDAVHRVVAPHESGKWLGLAVATRSWGDGRGLVGACAAAAWPGDKGTYEAILYRDSARWGTRRDLDPGVGALLDSRFPSTFDNWDPRHRHLRIAPASPCPILCGIRGTSPQQAVSARGVIGPEVGTGWLLLATNQATGDHLRQGRLGDAAPHSGIIVEATVVEPPVTLRGGHVWLEVTDTGGSIRVAAYEPTKELRDGVRALRVGDVALLEGSLNAAATVLALEAFTLIRRGASEKFAPDTCQSCGASGRSGGRRSGYVCTMCGRRLPAKAEGASDGSELVGRRVTAPIAVRRHLSRPDSLSAERLDLRRQEAPWRPGGAPRVALVA